MVKLQHGGYQATAIFDKQGRFFHGDLTLPRDVLTFLRNTLDEAQAALADTVADYRVGRGARVQRREQSNDMPR